MGSSQRALSGVEWLSRMQRAFEPLSEFAGGPTPSSDSAQGAGTLVEQAASSIDESIVNTTVEAPPAESDSGPEPAAGSFAEPATPALQPVVTPADPMQYDDRKDSPAPAPPDGAPHLNEAEHLTPMVTELQPMKITSKIESSLSEIPWTRTVAAGSLVVGALLLLAGRRKSALAVAAAGGAVALLENPEIVREAWNAMPRAVRSGQDFLVRIEDFIEELNKQAQHVRKVIVQD